MAKKCEQNLPHFRYWSLTLKLEFIMLSFVRSIRTGNRSLLPWFWRLAFALDHINYTRWLSIHLMDMLEFLGRNGASVNKNVF